MHKCWSGRLHYFKSNLETLTKCFISPRTQTLFSQSFGEGKKRSQLGGGFPKIYKTASHA